MAKRGVKSKGSKGGKNKTSQTSKPSPGTSASSNTSTIPEESALPKCPPYEKLEYAPTVTNEAVEAVQNLLGSPLRILLTDGRTIIGTLVNLDNYRNIILSNTYQAYLPATPGCTSFPLF